MLKKYAQIFVVILQMNLPGIGNIILTGIAARYNFFERFSELSTRQKYGGLRLEGALLMQTSKIRDYQRLLWLSLNFSIWYSHLF